MAPAGLPWQKRSRPGERYLPRPTRNEGKFIAGNFDQRDVQLFVNVDNLAFEMLPVGKIGDQRAFIAGDMGVGWR